MPTWVWLLMTNTLLQIRDLTAGYQRKLPILHTINVSVSQGQVVTLIGPNGAGKSTLIKTVARLLDIQSGEIHLNGTSVSDYRADQMGELGVSYVPQLDNIFRTLTVQQNLTLAANRLSGNRLDAIQSMYSLFPALEAFSSLRAGGLSGGQRQMLAIAMALIVEPRLMLMDEPTAGLSPKIAQEVLALIQRAAQSGVGILLVEQNAKAALAISDHAYVLAEGRNQIDGTGADVLDDPRLGKIYLGAWRQDTA